jgi:hypothetical protein
MMAVCGRKNGCRGKAKTSKKASQWTKRMLLCCGIYSPCVGRSPTQTIVVKITFLHNNQTDVMTPFFYSKLFASDIHKPYGKRIGKTT